jgi:hypothetical protein
MNPNKVMASMATALRKIRASNLPSTVETIVLTLFKGNASPAGKSFLSGD